MPVILVVDDSEVDRHLIHGLLEKESLGWIVEFAESAEQAVSKLTDDFGFAVDLIVTDMLMTGMNGLELVQFMHEQECPVPVVLVSGQGSETLAVEAIKCGAASYVPKDDLSSQLVTTIKQVLMAKRSEQSHAALLESIEDLRYRFRIVNDPELIPPLISWLQQTADEMSLMNNESQTRFGIAVTEAIVNAMLHGNLQLPADQVQEVRAAMGDHIRADVLEKRRTTAPFNERFVYIEALFTSKQIEVKIRDDGQGFDVALSEDRSHRGLTLIKNHVDDVAFNDSGNEIHLVKRRDVARAVVPAT